MHKVVVTDFINDDSGAGAPHSGRSGRRRGPGRPHEDELVGRIEDADAIMLYHNLR